MKATTRIRKITTVTVELSEEQVQEAVRRYVASSITGSTAAQDAALQTALATNASGVGVDFDTSSNFLRGAVVSVKLVETEEE